MSKIHPPASQPAHSPIPDSKITSPADLPSLLRSLSLQTHLAITELLGCSLYTRFKVQTAIDEMLEDFKRLSPEED